MFSWIWKAIKILDPLEKVPEERKKTITKVEGVLDGVYKDENIKAVDYVNFMAKYSENLEEKVKENPEFKFEYTKNE